MPSTFVKLDLAFTDPVGDVLTDADPMLNAGSLLLIDPAHPQNPWPAGVPASGSLVPNLAWAPASALIPASTEATLAATWTNPRISADGLVERTGKGGVHVATKHQAYTASRAANLAQGKVRDYIAEHPTHAFYISLWARYTQDDLVTTSGYGLRMAGINADAGDFLTLRRGSAAAFALVPSANRTGSRPKSSRALEPFILNGAVSALTGSPSASATLAIWNTAPSQGGNVVQPSWALYRLYIEDLTVSGNTYAAVDAADFSQYTAQVSTEGGRYNADTFTNPSTL